jgi:hypothetical protein
VISTDNPMVAYGLPAFVPMLASKPPTKSSAGCRLQGSYSAVSEARESAGQLTSATANVSAANAVRACHDL